jgi:hypothetical protein
MKYYLVMGSVGEYSDRAEWPVALYESEADAQKVAELAEAHSRKEDRIMSSWNSQVYAPWWKANVQLLYGNPAESSDRWPGYGEIQKSKPVREPNPWDPDCGTGDTYWVTPVELRTFPS